MFVAQPFKARPWRCDARAGLPGAFFLEELLDEATGRLRQVHQGVKRDVHPRILDGFQQDIHPV